MKNANDNIDQFTERQVELMTSILMAMVELRDTARGDGDQDAEEQIMRSIEDDLARLAYPGNDDDEADGG